MKKGQILEVQRERVREESGYYALLVSFRQEKKTGKNKTKAPIHTIKCGCGCNNKVEICVAEHNGLEIGGVEASVEGWRKVLLPLLQIKETETGFEDLHPILSLRKKYD